MNADKKTPIVLAFSGGLDTSYCVLELCAQGYEVHTVFVDTGGLSENEVHWIEERALSLGSSKHHELVASHEENEIGRIGNVKIMKIVSPIRRNNRQCLLF